MPPTTPQASPSITGFPKTRTPTVAGTPSPTSTPEKRLGLKDADLRGVVVRYWYTWSGAGDATMKALVDEFNLSNQWKIVIVPVSQGSPDEMSNSMNAALATDNTPDLVVGYLHQALTWQARKPLVDLNDYVNDLDWGLSAEQQDDFYPAFWEQDLANGQRLGVPAWRTGQMLFYNRTWAQMLGYVLPPETPEQFRLQTCAAGRDNLRDADAQNDGTGGWLIATNYAATLGWLYAYGGQVSLSPEPGIQASPYQFSSGPSVQAFTFLRSLFDQGCAWLADTTYPDEAFAARQALFLSASLLDIPYQAEAFRLAGKTDEWTVLPFPSPNGKAAFNAYGPSFEILPSSPQRQLAAWVFVRWLLQAQNQARLIEASGTFPLNASTLAQLETYQRRNPQWAAAVQSLPLAHSEPPYQSWSAVRWALSDASTQLFRSYFTINQVPQLLQYLDEVAADLHIGADLEQVFATLTETPTATATDTRTPVPSQTPKPTRTPWPSATPAATTPSP
ncbi:MAG: extracellular solute-binding protein [Chloroflexota bacterium]